MTFEDTKMLRMKFGIYSDLTGVLVFHLKMFEVYPEVIIRDTAKWN